MKLLEDFTQYCKNHPELRFWQALRNWSEADAILYSRYDYFQDEHFNMDTFYWEEKDKLKDFFKEKNTQKQKKA